MVMHHRNQSVDPHRFSMVPRADIPRSAFDRQFAHKTTFDSGYLIPVYVDEVLPGDTFNFKMTAFARLATPLFPVMDNMYLDSFFFFVPNRLIWDNWQRFMGEQPKPGDSIDFLVPQHYSPPGGYDVGSLQDYMGLPTRGQINAGNGFHHCAFWPRAYNLIWNEWFRDQNLQEPAIVETGDGPEDGSRYVLRRRGKRHDYFTSALPWPQKGGVSVSLPLGTQAPVKPLFGTGGRNQGPTFTFEGAGTPVQLASYVSNDAAYSGNNPTGSPKTMDWASTGLYADLTDATAATINQLRQAFQIQKLLERDARGGTRYTEIVRAHFGVTSPDARLQRPEYLGGGTSPILISPIAQTSASNITGSDSPLGNLGAVGTVLAKGHGFSQSFTEHGVIIGLVSVRADLTYQQGLRKMWSRKTRYDFYFPAFAMLGEQAIKNKEIYITGDPAQDDAVFGYQERWAEYRHCPSKITGQFRSTYSNTLDGWHLAQRFNGLPTLNSTFIEERPPVERVLAVGSQAGGQQFIFDSFMNCRTVRAMPLYSVPGLIDHF